MRTRILCSVLSLLTATPLIAADFSLENLMRLMRETPDPPVHYTEIKRSDLFAFDLESHGTLSLENTGTLTKTVQSAGSETVLTADHARLTLTRENQTRIISLRDYPVIGAFMAAFRATLRGDRDSLLEHYQADLSGDARNWNLVLTPLDAKLSRSLRSIEMTGTQGQPLVYIIDETSGDITTLFLGDRKP